MKTILLIILGASLASVCNAGIIKSNNDQGGSDSVQVLVKPGKTPTTYNPKTGEKKEIKLKEKNK